MYTIYSKSACGYCKRAKDLLDILGEEYVEISLDVPGNLEILTEHLGYAPKTVPQIWENEKHIGGYTELAAYTR